MPEHALVSIVLPTYRRAPLLRHAIRNILEQTYSNFELIVVDDNSPDDTPAVVRAFSDPRIRYIRNEQNLKLPRGLNKGFGMSRGDFLTWTSDDNYYAPEAIERMVNVLQTSDSNFVYADYFQFSDLDSSGAPMDVRHMKLPDTLRLETGNAVGACFLYTRRVYETVGEYDPELFLVEDYDYWIRIHKQFRIRHIAEPLYYFRRHDDALFCSRYAEVKAADVLVRYKNGLLDKPAALRACTDLVAGNLETLHNPLLRAVQRVLARTSYRLTQLYARVIRRYVQWRLSGRTVEILERFSSRASSFRDAKDALRAAMLRIATIEYKS